MSQRNITECDRCHYEIKGTARTINTGDTHGRKHSVPGGDMDLCDSCSHKLDRFLTGEELEVPP